MEITREQLDQARIEIFRALSGHYLDSHTAAERSRNLVQALLGGADEQGLDDMLRPHMPYGHGRLNAVFEIRDIWMDVTKRCAKCA